MFVGVVLMGFWLIMRSGAIASDSQTVVGADEASGAVLVSLQRSGPVDAEAESAALEREQRKAARTQTLQRVILPFLRKYCADCHGAESQEGDIVVHKLESVDQLLDERTTWQRVYRMINAGAMPPADHAPVA